MKRFQKIILTLLAVGLVGFFTGQKLRELRREKTALDAQKEVLETVLEKQQVPSVKIDKPVQQKVSESSIKPSVNFEIPFTPQAPFAVWDEVHEDACEEAAVLMAAFYRQGKSLNPNTAEDEIQKLVSWQTERFGYWKDTTAEETAVIAREYYGLKARVVYDFTIDQIKQELSDGNVVLVPSAGRKLGNPFYKQPGPVYHMLVLRGYDDKFIYTNDPGTKRGENYKYYPEIILSAAADWPGSDEKMLAGETRRAMITIDK